MSQFEAVAEVRRRFADSTDPLRAPQMQAHMKSAMPFRGVSAVPLRKVCREVFVAAPLPDRPTWVRAVLDLGRDNPTTERNAMPRLR